MKKMPNPIGTIETHKMAWQDFVNSGCKNALYLRTMFIFWIILKQGLYNILTNLPDIVCFADNGYH